MAEGNTGHRDPAVGNTQCLGPDTGGSAVCARAQFTGELEAGLADEQEDRDPFSDVDAMRLQPTWVISPSRPRP